MTNTGPTVYTAPVRPEAQTQAQARKQERTDVKGPGGTSRTPAVLRAPFEGRTWRGYLYVLTGLPLAVLGFSFAVTMVAAGAGLLVTFIGLPVLAAGLGGCRAFGRLERGRARALLDVHVAEPEPVRALQRRDGLPGRPGALLRSGVSWRHLLYAFAYFPYALFSFVVSVVFWSVGWALLLHPAYHWVFPLYTGQPGLQLWGDGQGNARYLDTGSEILAVSVIGLVLVLLTPWLVRGLTRFSRLLVGGLLGPSRSATRVREPEPDRVP